MQIGEEIDESYKESLISLCGNEEAAGLTVVYTPLHGAGLRTVQNIFPAAGIRDLHVVEEQSAPDGLFPTVKSPNPEDHDAMQMAISLRSKSRRTLPSALTRMPTVMGAAARDQDGNYRMLSGNQIGCILIAYLLENAKPRGNFHPQTTSSDLLCRPRWLMRSRRITVSCAIQCSPAFALFLRSSPRMKIQGLNSYSA